MTRLFSFFLAAWCATASSAQAVESKAKYILVQDYQTGAVMMSREPDTKMHPASMTKIMTVYLAFKALKEGKITPEKMFHVSEAAWRMQGSKMFVELGNDIKVDDLLHGIIVQSGNDACKTLAEGMAGSEETFAGLMNDEAGRLGMNNSHFMNSTGWPDGSHLTTARDLATLARATIRDFPDLYPYYAVKEFTYHGIRQHNRNLLLGRNLGVDGLKTGHTEQSGYGITVSGQNPEGRRVIVVVNGLESERARAEEAASLMGYAFGAFENVDLAKAHPDLGAAKVWMGGADAVKLTLGDSAVATLPVAGREHVAFTLRYAAPVIAPLEKGAQIGALTVRAEGMEEQKFPVFAAENVYKASFLNRAWMNFKLLWKRP